MRTLKLKSEVSGAARTPRQPSETVQSLPTKRQQQLTLQSDGSDVPIFTKPLLLLGKLTGALLGGVGVTALIGNLLICGAMLLLGPAFLNELLAQSVA